MAPDFPLHLALLFLGEVEGFLREESLQVGQVFIKILTLGVGFGSGDAQGAVHLIASISFPGPARIFPNS